MKTVEVKILLLKAELTEASIATPLGISQSYVHDILSGQATGYKYQTRIARMLKVKVADLFSTKRPKLGRPFKRNGK